MKIPSTLACPVKILINILLLLGILTPALSNAQDYPARAVTIVVPFPAGGSNDTIARYLADSLGKLWKQTVIVENKPGGGSSIGSAYVARSPADGYRMVLVSASYTTNAAARSDQQFDPLKDLKPVSMVARGHNAVVTGSRVARRVVVVARVGCGRMVVSLDLPDMTVTTR